MNLNHSFENMDKSTHQCIPYSKVFFLCPQTSILFTICLFIGLDGEKMRLAHSEGMLRGFREVSDRQKKEDL